MGLHEVERDRDAGAEEGYSKLLLLSRGPTVAQFQ